MFVEIDEVAVDAELWAKAEEGDQEALAKLREQFNGMVLYMHALSAHVPPHTWARIRDLERLGIISAITLHAECP